MASMITNMPYLKRKFPLGTLVKHDDGRQGRVRGYYRQPGESPISDGPLTVRVSLGSGRPSAIVPHRLVRV